MSGRFLPLSLTGGNPRRAAALSALGILAAEPAAAQAAADILNAFASEGDHLSNAFLSRIFGCRLFPVSGIDCGLRPAPVFKIIIGLFNLFCLALGMALFSWNTAVGVVQTAHEGEVLGRRWSSLWAPVRTLAAAAMLTPLPNMDGYNAIQASIGWLVRGSTAAATVVWAAAADQVIEHQAPVTAPDVMYDSRIVEAAWQMASCQAVVEHAAANMGEDAGVRVGPRIIQPRASAPSTRRTGGWNSGIVLENYLIFGTGGSGSKTAENLPHDTCGTIRTPRPPEIVTAPDSSGGAALTVWQTAHERAIGDLIGEMRTIADMFLAARLNGETPAGEAEQAGAARRITAAGDEYNRYLTEMLQQLTQMLPLAVAGSDRQAARERIQASVSGSYSSSCERRPGGADDWLTEICGSGRAGQGWLGAGAWYLHMARFANEASAIFHARPETAVPDIARSAESAAAGSQVDAKLRQETGFFKKSMIRLFGGEVPDEVTGWLADISRDIAERWNAAVLYNAASGGTIASGMIQGAFAYEGGAGISDAVRTWMADRTQDWFLPSATSDPMASLVEFGNTLMAMGLGFLAAGGAGSAVSALVSQLPFGDLVAALGGAATLLGGMLLAPGAFLAFILPLLPFLLWTAAVTGYFLLVAEAVIAVNLWAIAHLRLDGEGLAGEAARQGYYLLLALTLTPVLMVFGFLLGMAIFKITATLIGIGADTALRGLAHDQSWVVWFFGMAVVSIILVIVYVVLAERSFSLVAELPGKVLRWVGADANVSSREDDRIRGSAIAAGGGVIAGTEKLTGLTSKSAREALVKTQQRRLGSIDRG